MPRTGRLSGALAACVALTACGLIPFGRAEAPIEPGGLSSDAREALSERFPGWQPAVLDASVNGCAGGKTDLPLRLQYDGDGDDRPDLAMAIQTSKGTRLVVLLHRDLEVDIHDVDALGTTAANGFLDVVPRGRRFTNPATKLDDYFNNATMIAIRCGEPASAYRWTGVQFEKVVLEK